MKEYASGISPKAIAKKLNQEGIPSPLNGHWDAGAINGNRKRGYGILNNESYIGVLVWNRHRYIKNPDTGKRVPRPNPEEEWTRKPIPEWRIVDDELWSAVKDRQGKYTPNQKHMHLNRRPAYLLSGLLKCGSCGGGVNKSNHGRYACAAAHRRGTCDNKLKISRVELEKLVLTVLQKHLMDPKLCEVFCKEYTAELNRLRQERNARVSSYHAEMKQLKAKQNRIAESIMDGMSTHLFKDQADALLKRKAELEIILESSEEEPVLLHPNMAHRYHTEVQNLMSALEDESQRQEASEILRTLVEKIVLTPDANNEKLTIDLHGDLAGILRMAQGGKSSKCINDLDLTVLKVVAEERLELPTRGL